MKGMDIWVNKNQILVYPTETQNIFLGKYSLKKKKKQPAVLRYNLYTIRFTIVGIQFSDFLLSFLEVYN